MVSVFTHVRIQPLVDVPEFFAQVARWHHQECARQGLTSSLPLRQTRLKTHMENRVVPQTLVAMDGDDAIGCVSLIHYRASTKTAPVKAASGKVEPTSFGDLSPVWLSNLFVREDLRRQGLGELLITAAKTYAKDIGCAELWLSSADYTDFYQKRGWNIVRQARLGGSMVNVMKLRL